MARSAIEGGLSCRAAAQRFGVSASSAIQWRAQERREGDIKPKLQGGDRHSHRIEAHAELILSAVAAKSDITLSELRDCHLSLYPLSRASADTATTRRYSEDL